MLIAIAIIAILFALTMLALKSARESAYCLQVRTQLPGVTFKSSPKILAWTNNTCIKVQWIEAATSDHPRQIGLGEFDVEQNTFLSMAYTPAP